MAHYRQVQACAAVPTPNRLSAGEHEADRAVCDRFNAAGVPTPGGGPTWYPFYISRLLRTRSAQEFNRARHRCTAVKGSARSVL